ncbi:MAG TPA: SPOR domain-containing protein [Bryobacteraceae bacterium]|jgi:cell division septation protein DedD
MKNAETGEFELVLGNRQLLSGFFIVVLLFGVAFAMGYIVGRNSSPSTKLQAETATGASVPKESRRDSLPATPPPVPADSGSRPPAADTPTASKQTAETPEQPAPATSREALPAAPAEAPTPSAAEAPPGSYWQVIATSNRTAAEALQQSLKDKGFPATLGPGPNNLVRVLVGPYTDTQAMGRAKTQLEAAGLHPVRK